MRKLFCHSKIVVGKFFLFFLSIVFSLWLWLHKLPLETCVPLDRDKWPTTGVKEPSNLTFVKFHKVGGTTVALMLQRFAKLHGFKFCCDKGCDICAEHYAIGCARYGEEKCLEKSSTHLVALFRDPIEQLLSWYGYHAKMNFRHFRETPKEILEFLEKYQTRDEVIRGSYDTDVAYYFCGDNTRDAETPCPWVSDIIRKFDLVGLTEQLDEFLVALATIFDWEVTELAYGKRYKKVFNRPKIEDFDPHDIERLRRLPVNAKKQEVYKEARRRNSELMGELRRTCEFQANWAKFVEQLPFVREDCTYKSIRTDPKVKAFSGSILFGGFDCYDWKRIKTDSEREIEEEKRRQSAS